MILHSVKKLDAPPLLQVTSFWYAVVQDYVLSPKSLCEAGKWAPNPDDAHIG